MKLINGVLTPENNSEKNIIALHGSAVQPKAEEKDNDVVKRVAAVRAKYEQPELSDEEKEIAALPEDQRQFVKDNQGIAGTLRVGAESAGNELLFGAPEMLYKHFADPKDVAQHEALKHFHETANVVGGGIGALGSLAIGGPIFKGAAEAGRLAEGLALGGRAAEEATLGRTIAVKILGGAAEGAVVGAPQTLTNAAIGDPKQAAENLIFSAGIGALLGPAAFGIKKGLTAAGESVAPKLAELSEKYGTKLTEELESGGEKTKEKVQEYIGDAIKDTAKHLGLYTHGVGGAVAGAGVGALASGAAKAVIGMIPEEYINKALQATLKANKLAATELDRIPDILEGLSNSSFAKALKPAASTLSLAGKDIAAAGDDYEAFKKLSEKLAHSQANGTEVETIGNNSAALKHNAELQSAYQETALNATNYLRSIMPKNPNPVQMFSKQDAWKPSDLQLKQFKSQLDIVHNPYSVLDKLKAGTVTKQDVDTLKNVYPAIYGKITDEILKHATNPKYDNLSYQAKTKLSLLTGIPISQSFEPQNIRSLQANFQQASSQDPNGGAGGGGGSKKALSNMPSLQTETQNLAAGLTGTGQVK